MTTHLSPKSTIQPLINLGGWLSFTDNTRGISFQYPPQWTVVQENEYITRISPPYAETRIPTMQGDGDVAIYGIRIMPLVLPYGSGYSSFPVLLTENDVNNRLSHIHNLFFRKEEIYTDFNDDPLLLVYDVGHYDRSLLALKSVSGDIMQIELGHNFPGNTLSDIVAFFGVVSTLRGI